MRGCLLALTIVLSTSAVAEETLVLSNGSRMTVMSYEVKGNVVVITTIEGGLRSLPLAYIDLDATKALTSPPAEKPRPTPPPSPEPPSTPSGDRKERVRLAVGHYAGEGRLSLFIRGIDRGLGKSGESLPQEMHDQFTRAMKAPFDTDQLFDDATERLLSEADPRAIDAWLRFLETPLAKDIMAREQEVDRLGFDGVEPNLEALDDDGATPLRKELVSRLNGSLHLVDTMYDMFTGALYGLIDGMTRNATPMVAQLMEENGIGGADKVKLPESTKDNFLVYFEYVYDSIEEAELERYVAFWESPEGLAVGLALNKALVASLRHAGETAGTSVAEMYADYFPGAAPSADVDTPPAKPARFEELNFQFMAPPAWAPFEASRLNPEATLGYLRTSPHVVFMIVAEGGAEFAGVTSEQGASIARANLEAGAERYALLSEERLSVSGMDGILILSEARVGSRELLYANWAYAENDHLYQLAAWGDATKLSPDELKQHAVDVYSGFSILERVASPDVSPSLLADFRSDKYGYSMRLAESGWSAWDELESELPAADVGALYGSVAAFFVVPVYLGDLDPSLEALAAGLLTTLDIDFNQVANSQRRSFDRGGQRGLHIDYERTVNETDYVYRLEVFESQNMGYLVASWIRDGEDTAVLDDLMERFGFDAAVAVEPTPDLTDEETRWEGTILNDIGIVYFDEGQYAKAAPFLDAASEKSPDDAVILQNLVSALSATGRFEDGLSWIERRADRFPDRDLLHSYRPFFLAKLGRLEESATAYKALFDGGYQNDDDLYDYTEVLWQLDRKQDAIDTVIAYRKDRDSIGATRLLAYLYRRTEDYDRALELLEEKHRAFPADSDLALVVLDTYYDAERYERVVELAEQFIEKNGASEDLHFRKGRAELAMDRYEGAKTSFQAALELNPSDADLREYLDYVTGLLGQGDHQAVQKPIDAVSIPPILLTPAKTSLDDETDYGAYYASRVTAISFESGQDYRRTERYVVRLTDQKAVSSFSSFEFEFHPLAERIYVNELRVLDEHGKTVSTGDLETFYVTDDTSDDMATASQILNIPVPGLEPGNTLELTITWQRTSPPESMPFIRHTFASPYPSLRASLYVTGSVERLRHAVVNLAPPRRGSDDVYWMVDEPPVYRAENLADTAESFLPFVWVGDGAESWESLAAEYLEELRDRFELDESTRQLAMTLVEGRDTSEARIAALAEYVQDNLTYKAIEFGRRARIPNFASQIVENRYGDCKDHSLLFYQLLRAVDEPANLVLVSTSSEVQPHVPSLDQFDHMIVYTTAHRDGHFFDLTDKNHDVSSLPPMGLGGTEGLLLDAAEPALVTLPEYPEDSNRIVAKRHLEVEKTADLVVDETLTLEGYYAAWLRSALKSSDAATQKQLIQRYMRSGSHAVVEEVSAENLADPRQSLVLHVRYRLPGALYAAEGKLVGRVPAIWERTFLDVTPVEDRQTPYRIEYPVRVESEITVTPPSGYRITSGPSDDENAGPILGWKVKTDRTGPSLVLHSETWRPSGRGAASEYPVLASRTSSFLSTLEGSFVLEKTVSE